MPDAFPPEIIAKLGYYVYRLIDPRNGETFYVGKGQGNRVFSHARAEQELEGDAIDNKLKRIYEIRLAGFEVSHVIHRHGMDHKTALVVEAALIDAYPGLTNLVTGHGGNDYGVMHAQELIQRYTAAEKVDLAGPWPSALIPGKLVKDHSLGRRTAAATRQATDMKEDLGATPIRYNKAKPTFIVPGLDHSAC